MHALAKPQRTKTIPTGNVSHFRAVPAATSTGRLRASNPKVKTGYYVCDETHPSCKRCTKFGVDCDGYDDQKISVMPRRTALPKLIQRNGQSLRYQPLAPVFKDDQDFQYFTHFRNHTSPILSGGFDTSLWDHVVLQACESEPSLRQLTVSLGALNVKSPGDLAFRGTYARMQYGKALKAVRESLAKRPASGTLRIALLAALLIFCFDNQFGDPVLALGHIQSVLSLLRKQLASMSRRSYRHLRNISPTADLEFDLISVFARLDNYIVGRFYNVDAARSYVLNMSYDAEEFNVPETFTNITMARDYIEHFQFRAIPSIPHDFMVDIQNKARTLDDYIDEENALPSPAYEHLSAQLGQWNTAFRPLFDLSRTPEGHKLFLPATMLRIQAVAVDTLIRATHLSGSQRKDKDLNHQCREIVFLCRRAIAHPDFLKTFVFDAGLIPALTCVLLSSHERSIVEEAVRIGEEIYPRREGVWDSVTIVEMGEEMLKENYGSHVKD